MRALAWIKRLWQHKLEHGLTPRLCIENLEYPKYPATFGEVRQSLEQLRGTDLDQLGLVFDVAHHWHNYRHLLRQANPNLIVDEKTYPLLLLDHLRQIASQFPDVIEAFHFAQAYIDPATDTHVTHGLPGSVENTFTTSFALINDPFKDWLNTASLMKVLRDFTESVGVDTLKLVLEVHHRQADELNLIAQAILDLWAQSSKESNVT